MTKDELKNRISFALKDPILQQGFEIICKENAELGKHNEELIALINAERERQEKCDDVHLRKITDLEKENAELKEKVSYLKDNLRVARKDREELQLDVAKGLKEFVKDFPATAIRYLANEKYVEENENVINVVKQSEVPCMNLKKNMNHSFQSVLLKSGVNQSGILIRKHLKQTCVRISLKKKTANMTN